MVSYSFRCKIHFVNKIQTHNKIHKQFNKQLKLESFYNSIETNQLCIKLLFFVIP